MSKKVKGLVQAELKGRFEDVSDCAVVSLRGIGGTANNRLRGDLADKGIRLTMVKNSLAGAAFEELGRGEMKQLLKGPCAICYGGDSVVDVVKVLAEQAKELETLQIKGAYLDGEILEAEQAQALAKFPSRSELQGMVVMLANSPGSRAASVILSPGSVIAGCLEALVEKLETAAA